MIVSFFWILNNSGFVHMGSGLSVGFAGIAAGLAIGIVGDACVRGYVQEPKVRYYLVLVFFHFRLTPSSAC